MKDRMINSGIVRKINEIGRIVIPKELREKLGIKSGDDLEIHYNQDGIFLKKYVPYNEDDWEKAKEMLLPILPSFCILNRFGDLVKYAGVYAKDLDEAKKNHLTIEKVLDGGERIAYLVANFNITNTYLKNVSQVLAAFLKK